MMLGWHPNADQKRKRSALSNRARRTNFAAERTPSDLLKLRLSLSLVSSVPLRARILKSSSYHGDKDRMRPDVANLIRQGLVAEKSIPHSDTAPRRLLTLTKKGHQFLRSTGTVPRNQATYYGFTKPREAHHDADLYRLYHKAVEDIERQGGKNPRVVLDFELKKRVFHDLAKLGPEKHSAESKREIAEKHGLQLVRGKIPLPDLRIEYEGRDGDMARVDLELATEHYRGSNLAEKVRAGFSLYARAQDAPGLRRVLDQKELTAEILSL